MLMARAGSSSSAAADVEDQRRKYLKDDDFAYDTREGEMNERRRKFGSRDAQQPSTSRGGEIRLCAQDKKTTRAEMSTQRVGGLPAVLQRESIKIA